MTRLRSTLTLILVVASSVNAVSQTDDTPYTEYDLPPIEITRWSENYQSLGDIEGNLVGIDRLKWITIARENDITMSFGGSMREQFESFQNREFGFAEGDDDAYLMHRGLLHVDLMLGSHARMFVELGNSLIVGRDAEPSPVDENELYVSQSFVDLTPVGDEDLELRIRLGRQELPLGSGRLVSLRDGPNNRLSFDAARISLTTTNNNWSFDAFIATPVELRPGVFDDRFNDEAAFWGFYTSLPNPIDPNGGLDLYYLGISRKDRQFAGIRGSEMRHSLGLRFFGDVRGFDYNIEAVGQIGQLGKADIRAWTVASDIGFTWDQHPWRPRLGLRANISGGNRGDDDTSETFDPLFPNNSYFSEAAILSPSNLIDFNPAITVRPSERLEVLVMWDFAWLTSSDDAAYGPPGVQLYDPAESNGRFVGNSLSSKVVYQLDRHSSFTVAYTHFFAGDAVSSASGEDVEYLALWYEFKF